MKGIRCFAIDLVDDIAAIAEYERIHQTGMVWPEVITDLRKRGYRQLSIWRTGNRLFMIADIDVASAIRAEGALPSDRVKQWDQLTKTLQRALPADDGVPRWIEMKCIFDLSDQ